MTEPSNLQLAMAAVDSTETLLATRSQTHGKFSAHARITQDLKKIMYAEVKWQLDLTDMERESLDMIVHKIGRILAGNPHFADHWDDIAGYAILGKGGQV